ncbi:hypothetical protein V8Z74_08775 [Comamonas sp. w2-DMI]
MKTQTPGHVALLTLSIARPGMFRNGRVLQKAKSLKVISAAELVTFVKS